MNIEDIKESVDNDLIVNWKSDNYQVVKDGNNKYLVFCLSNYTVVGLSDYEGELVGSEVDFYLSTSQ